MARPAVTMLSARAFRSTAMCSFVLTPRSVVSLSCTRGFATRAPFQEADLARLKVNGSRMMETLHKTCEFGKAHPYGAGGPTETGMARLTLNDDDKKVREWLVREVEKVGCKVTVDKIGNMFAVRPGQQNDLAPVYMGSHLDTQPTGGRYDGILGVMAALEAMRTIHENGIQTHRPIGLVNWTNEEGARFPKTTLGSSVWAGTLDLEEAWRMPEVESLAQDSKTLRTVKQELERIGFLGSAEASYKTQPIAAHFELHIEQGPILEEEELMIGVVRGGQAYSWYEIEVSGRDAHAGTTPFKSRSDPMVAAAEIILKAKELAKEHDGLATVAIMNASPGSINTIPHTVKFTLDIRNPSTEAMEKQWAATRQAIDSITASSGKNTRASIRELTWNNFTEFSPACVDAVKTSAEATLGSGDKKLWKYMVSGAGHDSCAVQMRAPAAMIFTRTKDGMSHCPDEYCSPEDCELGAQVLLGAVLRYELTSRGN